ncbi:MAG: ABC transporter ATP-binding protein [Clostridia bacterium]|nr:ABC transporter ATP-binding protein [Clostridia bacterium]
MRESPENTQEILNLCVPQGSILGLIGENGAGKSTTIKLIMNAIKKDEGEISVLGCKSDDQNFVKIKEDIGIVLDEAYFPETLNALKIGKVMKLAYQNWDDECYRNYLNQLSLPENKSFKEFSRGMKMKLAIATALSHRPRLLVLDEATSGLDPIIRDELLDVFNDFTRDETHSILISSHITSDLEKICDYVAFIHEGRLVFQEEKDRLLEKYVLLKMTEKDFAALNEEAVKGVKHGTYGVEVLALREQIPSTFVTERLNLEDIILFLAKGGTAK